MPPHQEGHRHSGSFASMPLQHHTPPDGLKNTGSGPLAGFLTVATTTTQCAEASPHPPLDSTSLSLPRRKHCERGLVTPAIVPRSESVSHVVVEVQSKDAPLPEISSKQPSHRRRSTLPRCFTLALATAAIAASQGSRLHHLPTLHRTGWP
jgi:hypothetical protein